MEKQVVPYLTFNGNCREAMSFYKECLGGELQLQTAGDSPMKNQFSDQQLTHVIHSSLKNESLLLLASDMTQRNELVDGNSISLSLSCDSEQDLWLSFNKLAAGGQVVHPIHTFFAGMMGTLTDRFNKDWLLYYIHRDQRL